MTTAERVKSALRTRRSMTEDEVAWSTGLTGAQVKGGLAALQRKGNAKSRPEGRGRVWELTA